MKLVVGLGNPGRKYAKTRHNIGFLCLEAYAHDHKLSFKSKRKFSGELAEVRGGLLLKPTTYMNLSGNSIQKVVNFYNIKPEDILVIYDDLDLPTGKLRLRYKGGAGGHKGMLSMFSVLPTETIKRVRFGIGRHERLDVKDYVLSTFYKEEGDDVIAGINTVKNIIDDFLAGTDFLTLMNQYN